MAMLVITRGYHHLNGKAMCHEEIVLRIAEEVKAVSASKSSQSSDEAL
jgi:hypothetical protein